MTKLDISYAIKKIQQLHRLQQQLSASPLAPKNTWISQYTVEKYYEETRITHYYTYAKWESREPIFECNPKPKNKADRDNAQPPNTEDIKYTRHRHIGRVSSSTHLPMDWEVSHAYRELRNRRWLDRVEAALSNILLAIHQF